MTQELKPQDLKVGDLVDVTLHQFKVMARDINGDIYFEAHRRSAYVPINWLSNATITRSPEVIEVGDVVQGVECRGVVLSIAKGHTMVEADNGDIWLELLSDLTLVSKGAKS